MSASVNLPLHHEVQKFSSGTGSPGWSEKKGRKTVVVWWCGGDVWHGHRVALAVVSLQVKYFSNKMFLECLDTLLVG